MRHDARRTSNRGVEGDTPPDCGWLAALTFSRLLSPCESHRRVSRRRRDGGTLEAVGMQLHLPCKCSDANALRS